MTALLFYQIHPAIVCLTVRDKLNIVNRHVSEFHYRRSGKSVKPSEIWISLEIRLKEVHHYRIIPKLLDLQSENAYCVKKTNPFNRDIQS